MLQKRQTLVKRYRHKKSGCVVCIPDFVAVLGTVFAAAASLLGVYAVLTASGQLSEMLVIYLICGGGQWLGIYAAALTIRWRIVVKGSELTVYPLFSKIYQINLYDVLSAKWGKLRGIEIVSFGVSSVKASEEDEQMLKEMQRNAAFMDPTRAAAHLVGAQASAMQTAAGNQGAGPAMAFMGMNMAGAAGGMNAQNLYQMGAQQPAAQPAPAPAPAPAGWTCSCGQTGNTGKFCANCGSPKPAPAPAAASWVCSCGTSNTGKFCCNCGSPKPAPAPAKCSQCGWTPDDPAHPPKFCPECGKPFGQ